jgi:hypothetical protein
MHLELKCVPLNSERHKGHSAVEWQCAVSFTYKKLSTFISVAVTVGLAIVNGHETVATTKPGVELPVGHRFH